MVDPNEMNRKKIPVRSNVIAWKRFSESANFQVFVFFVAFVSRPCFFSLGRRKQHLCDFL